MGKIKITKKTTTEPTTVPINNQIRNDWNLYVDWLDKKGLRGKPELDKNDFGNRLIDQYRLENPTTTISRNVIRGIQQDILNKKEWVKNEIASGRGAFDKYANEVNLIRNPSDPDNYAGSLTSLHKFPLEYMRAININKQNGKEISRDTTMQQIGLLQTPPTIIK